MNRPESSDDSCQDADRFDTDRFDADRFAADLERLDECLAEQGSQSFAESEGTIDSQLQNAKQVLQLINRVRVESPDTEPRPDETHVTGQSPEHSDGRGTMVRQRVGPYVIEEQIARGGMGIVFRARDTKLGRVVALKMMLAGPFAYEEERKRFRVEAESAAQLDHPGIVPVYEVGEEQSQLYFSMGFVDGESLSQHIRDEPLSPQAAAGLARQIAAAVHYAHGQGVVHRDIKPANILLDKSGRARITDFGLARRTDSISDLTGTEQILGTPSYMAPEQASGNASEAGVLADVYSIGSTLYCMITGRPPFQASSPTETVRMVIDQEPVAPRQLNPLTPIDLNTLCLKCLQKEPSRRYQSAADLEADLERFLNGVPIVARPIGIVERTWKWSRRHPLVAGLSSAVVAALLAMLVGGAWYQAQLNQTLDDLQTSRSDAVDHLYRSLTGEAEFLNEVRPLGYGPRVGKLLAEARDLESTQKDLPKLRQLAVSGLGYVGAREPLDFPKVDSVIRSANVLLDSNQLVVGLDSGDLVFFDLATTQKTQQLRALDVPAVRIDVDLPNRGQDGKRIRVVGPFAEQIAEVTLEEGTAKLSSISEPKLPKDFLGIEMTSDGRSLIGVQPATNDLLTPDRWVTPSTLLLGSEIGPGRRRPADTAPIHFAVASLVDPEHPVRLLPAPLVPRFDVNQHYLVVGGSWLDDPNVDDSIVVYDHRTGKVEQEMNSTCGALLNVRISRNGYFVAAGSDNGFEIFERYTGKRLVRNLDVGSCVVESFIGDDGDVLIGTETETLWYSPAHRQPLARFARSDSQSLLQVSAESRYLTRTRTKTPRVIDTLGNQRIRIAAHPKTAKSVSFSTDGRLLLSSTQYHGGNPTKVWDASNGEYLFEFVGAESVFSPNGKWIASWSGGFIKLWDVASGKLVASSPYKPFPMTIRFSTSGHRIVAASRFAGEFGVWQVDTGDEVAASNERESKPRMRRVFFDSDGTFPVALSPSGNRVAYGRGKKIRIHDIEADQSLAEIEPKGNLLSGSLGFLNEDQLFLVAGKLHLYDVSNGVTRWTSEYRHQPPLVFSPDRSHLFCRRKLVRVSDLSEVFELPAWLGPIVAADWSPDGRRVAFGSDRGDVTLWDLPAIQESLHSQSLPWTGMVFSPESNAQSVSQMIRVGSRHAGQFNPRQWKQRFEDLMSQMDEDVDGKWTVRETNWLADRLDRIASRPFFETESNNTETLGRMGDVYNLAMQLQKRKEYATEQRLLKSMQVAFEQLEDPSPEITLKAMLIYHTSGDLHNFFFPNSEVCFESYAIEEKLADSLLQESNTSQIRSSMSTSLFWLHRNLALAHKKHGDIDAACDRMKRALQIAEEFTDLGVDTSIVESGYESLASWLESAGQDNEAEAVRNGGGLAVPLQ